MSGNTFGKKFSLTTFGESHGEAIGGIIDGCPSNIELDLNEIQHELNRRKPGQSNIVTQRKESDTVQFLSGIFEGKTTGTPIGFIIPNENQKSKDYGHLADHFRPSHADYTYQKKYGIRDYRGGGRSSARETACRVVAGAIAKQIIQPVKITAFVSSIGNISLQKSYKELDLNQIETNAVRCPEAEFAVQMEELIKTTRKQGDTLGGIITCVVQNVPAGLGNPVFDRLEADLAKAMLSINATKGFEIGSGFTGTQMKGSQHNDYFNPDGSTKTNFSGGVQGGISNGMDIYFNVAFKPVATLMQPQEMLSESGEIRTVDGKGRHDVCVVPRAVPIVEAMTALVLADFIL
ncbi:chorismate synthase [Avrilella dinanensis]|uniref:chorismate synthase n=1 Tax=Avrilella dinanensis TaxID=2008672 RepID=UPI0024095F21|nr:chorismate synthase [Avrilella dinanensis]